MEHHAREVPRIREEQSSKGARSPGPPSSSKPKLKSVVVVPTPATTQRIVTEAPPSPPTVRVVVENRPTFCLRCKELDHNVRECREKRDRTRERALLKTNPEKKASVKKRKRENLKRNMKNKLEALNHILNPIKP